MTIILENVCGYIPVVVVSTLIHNVCAAVLEAYRRKDGLILRQIVEFFIEWVKSSSSVLTGYNKYREQVESMLQVSLYYIFYFFSVLFIETSGNFRKYRE